MKGCWVSREIIYVSSKRTWESSSALYDYDALSSLTFYWVTILQWVSFKNIMPGILSFKSILKVPFERLIDCIGWILLYSVGILLIRINQRIKRPLVRKLISNFCPLGQHSWGIENSQDNGIYRRWMAGENTGEQKQEKEQGTWRSRLEKKGTLTCTMNYTYCSSASEKKKKLLIKRKQLPKQP